MLAERMIEENRELNRRVRALEEITSRIEAEELIAAATEDSHGVKIITKIFNDRDPESLKRLAQTLTARRRTVVLLGSHDKDAARLVFARSAGAPGDMGALMRDACATIDGRGGGKPDLAQGGGRNAEKVGEAIAQAVKAFL